MPIEASVIIASVVSGTISETDPTNVVLPAPKPPETTIFADVMVCAPEPTAASASVLKPTESTQHPFHQQQVSLGAVLTGQRLVHVDQTGVRGVADQHPRHAERHAQG